MASFLDSLVQSVSSTWDSAKDSLFGSSEHEKMVGNLNRLVSVLVMAVATNNEKQAKTGKRDTALSDAIIKLGNETRTIVAKLVAADSRWRLLLPDIVKGYFQGAPGITVVPYAQWRTQTEKARSDGGQLQGLGSLGLLPVIPIVIVIVTIGVGSTAYLLTSEGRQRMAIAQKTADTTAAIAEAVAKGQMTAAEGERAINMLPKAPPESSGGGLFDTLGKSTMLLVAAGIGGFFLLQKMGGSAPNITLNMPGRKAA